MRVGTKSILFGAHQFLLHPLFVAAAWWKLYGFPWDPRLWVAFFVHDLGYWSRLNMDGPEGEAHVFLGAKIMGALFDLRGWRGDWDLLPRLFNWILGNKHAHIWTEEGWPRWHSSWYCFSFYHSRFMAKRYNVGPSRLCFADKLATALAPWWLYVPLTRLTGEIREYREVSRKGKCQFMGLRDTSDKQWFLSVQEYFRNWVAEHKDGQADTWISTPLDYREGESGESV